MGRMRHRDESEIEGLDDEDGDLVGRLEGQMKGADVQGFTGRLQQAAEKRGHGRQTAYAGVGGLVGGIAGSFRGPLGAAIGALLGALFGALVGWDRDRKKEDATLHRRKSARRVAGDRVRIRVPDVSTAVEAEYVTVSSRQRARRA